MDRIPNWREVVYKDFPDPGAIKQTPYIWGTKEYEARREKVLNKPLP
jgi:hypothetical protein